LNRKAEVISLHAPARAPRRPRTAPLRARRAPFGARPSEEPSFRAEAQNDTSAAWQLIHDDPFATANTDEQIDAVVASFATRGEAPYTDMLRRLVGMEDPSEDDARAFFARVLEHRRSLTRALDRPVHVRVAAFDLLSLRAGEPGARRDSHPIIVTPSQLERAFEEATADGVTGLPQRAQFMNVLRHELRQRRRRNVCVAYIDLDHFKAVNDLYGHARGDDVLRALARSARGALREGDVLARIGGDEFAVLLVDVTPDEAEAAVGRLRERFEALTVTLGTSFSAGIAFATPGEDADGFVTRADQEMFRQKRSRAAGVALDGSGGGAPR
jgi:diguanylate cyclase (GGDEF)-like protein